MMHVSLALSAFTSLILLPLTSLAEPRFNCRSVSKSEVSKQAKAYGQDPGVIVRKVAGVLHNQFRKHNKNTPNQIFQDDGDFRIQMSIFYNYFALGSWTSKLSPLQEAAELDASTGLELDYAFTQWLRTRYLSSVRELVRDHELASVFRDNIRPDIKARVIDKPAELIVTGYQPFQCKTRWDQAAYICDDRHVLVSAQLSPYTLCKNHRLASQSQFLYLVNVSGTKFRIADVEFAGRRLFQDALIDLTSLFKNNGQSREIIETLKLWSYTKPVPTRKDFLQAFESQLIGPPTLKKQTNRIPASQ